MMLNLENILLQFIDFPYSSLVPYSVTVQMNYITFLKLLFYSIVHNYCFTVLVHLKDRLLHLKDRLLHFKDRLLHFKDRLLHLKDRLIHFKDCLIHFKCSLLLYFEKIFNTAQKYSILLHFIAFFFCEHIKHRSFVHDRFRMGLI